MLVQLRFILYPKTEEPCPEKAIAQVDRLTGQTVSKKGWASSLLRRGAACRGCTAADCYIHIPIDRRISRI